MGAIVKIVQARILEYDIDVRFPVCDLRSLGPDEDVEVTFMGHSMDFSFFDDAMFMFLGKAQTLLKYALFIAATIFDTFAERGMGLHTVKGKSAMLFQFRGVGSDRAKSDLWRNAQEKMSVPTRHLGDISLYAVR
eukprot:3841370-Pyramimonas_sp.AAC.1